MSDQERLNELKAEVESDREKVKHLEQLIDATTEGRTVPPAPFEDDAHGYVSMLKKKMDDIQISLRKKTNRMTDLAAAIRQERINNDVRKDVYSTLKKAFAESKHDIEVEERDGSLEISCDEASLGSIRMEFSRMSRNTWRSHPCKNVCTTIDYKTRTYKVKKDGSLSTDKIVERFEEVVDEKIRKKESDEASTKRQQELLDRILKCSNDTGFEISADSEWKRSGYGRHTHGYERRIVKAEKELGHSTFKISFTSAHEENVYVNIEQFSASPAAVTKMMKFFGELVEDMKKEEE